MPGRLSLEKEVLIFERRTATGNPQSVESVNAVQTEGSGELRLLELNTPLRGRLIFGTKHGDEQDILLRILEICKSKGIETKVTPEAPG
jgi:hypothetical protein